MDAPSQNQSLPFDTTGDAHVSPIDLLAIVNYLNAPRASGEEGGTTNTADPGDYMLDVNGDSAINTTDAALVTDYLNSPLPPTTGTTGGGTTSSMMYPPPTVAITSIPGSVNEGQVITISGVMTNSYGIFGDFGANWKQISHAWDSTFGTWSFTGFYTDDDATGTPSDTRTITVTAINMMSVASTTSPLTVNNVAPTIRPLGTLTPVNEGTQLDLAIKFTDAIAYYTTTSGINMAEMVRDTYSIVVDWGDGASNTYSASYITPQNQTPGQPFQTDITINASHTYLDDGPSPGNGTASDDYNVSIIVTDDDTGSHLASASKPVLNAAPAFRGRPTIDFDFDDISGDIVMSVLGQYSDEGAKDVHTLMITTPFGQWTTTLGNTQDDFSVTELIPIDDIADIYPIELELKDDDGGSADFVIEPLGVCEIGGDPLQLTSGTLTQSGQAQTYSMGFSVEEFADAEGHSTLASTLRYQAPRGGDAEFSWAWKPVDILANGIPVNDPSTLSVLQVINGSVKGTFNGNGNKRNADWKYQEIFGVNDGTHDFQYVGMPPVTCSDSGVLKQQGVVYIAAISDANNPAPPTGGPGDILTRFDNTGVMNMANWYMTSSGWVLSSLDTYTTDPYAPGGVAVDNTPYSTANYTKVAEHATQLIYMGTHAGSDLTCQAWWRWTTFNPNGSTTTYRAKSPKLSPCEDGGIPIGMV